MAVRRRVWLAELRRSGRRRSNVPWRESLRHLAGHRRDPRLQPGERVLQGGLAQADGVRRRTGSPGARDELLVHRSRLGDIAWWEVLAAVTDVEMASHGLHAGRAGVWLRNTRSLR